MAHAATYPDVYPKAGVFTRLNAWFFATMEKIAENNPRIRRVRKLEALSDAQLAALGIRRADIVHHVFRDAYYR
ncbi:DUF1127 domain-containing protein [Thalassococcus profundi]|uniref:DUF1127 domain-containing protein n=1 Tax=Thalassococcus profundi TaxID=2282382 RepID=A0A369TMI5_9RHOB|nr:DUF1127 domain-containing protein [Thalassococcus profundi]RDD66410.1 DUF1127 domain-containing protein [Thalassococcus profundi]